MSVTYESYGIVALQKVVTWFYIWKYFYIYKVFSLVLVNNKLHKSQFSGFHHDRPASLSSFLKEVVKSQWKWCGRNSLSSLTVFELVRFSLSWIEILILRCWVILFNLSAFLQWINHGTESEFLFNLWKFIALVTFLQKENMLVSGQIMVFITPTQHYF